MDVAAPTVERGGDVLIAVGKGFGMGRRGRRRPGPGMGRRCPHRRWGELWDRATWTSPPRPGNGEVMSSSPLGGALGQGDVDVAAPALERGGDVLIAVGWASWTLRRFSAYRLGAHAEALHLVVDALLGDAEDAGGSGLVAVALPEGFDDRQLLDVFEGTLAEFDAGGS